MDGFHHVQIHEELFGNLCAAGNRDFLQGFRHAFIIMTVSSAHVHHDIDVTQIIKEPMRSEILIEKAVAAERIKT